MVIDIRRTYPDLLLGILVRGAIFRMMNWVSPLLDFIWRHLRLSIRWVNPLCFGLMVLESFKKHLSSFSFIGDELIIGVIFLTLIEIELEYRTLVFGDWRLRILISQFDSSQHIVVLVFVHGVVTRLDRDIVVVGVLRKLFRLLTVRVWGNWGHHYY